MLRNGTVAGIAAALALLAGSALAGTGPGGGASPGTVALAERLLRHDPGARVGGNTIVAVADGAWVAGVPGRANFILGLGDDQHIVGGDQGDQLGFHRGSGRIVGGPGDDFIRGGSGAEVLHGGDGHDLIHGGPGCDVMHGGAGDDVIVKDDCDRIRGGGGRDRVVLASDVTDLQALRSSAAVARQAVTGDGSNGNPFTAPCDDPGNVDCTVSFPARALHGLWNNEFVPAYKCPADHPYLRNQSYEPLWTTLPPGVEVVGLGPIGVSISGVSKQPMRVVFPDGTRDSAVWTGTLTGYPWSSATNWTTGDASYQIKLHCTSRVEHGITDG